MFRLLGIHQGFVLRAIAQLRALGFNAHRIVFEQNKYLRWLEQGQLPQSSTSIAVWGVEIIARIDECDLT